MNPNADLLRSTPISEFVGDLIRDMPDKPQVLVFLLVQQRERYAPVTERMAQFKESYITFSQQTVFGIPFGLCILGFEPSTPVALNEFFSALASTPFDEGAVYVHGRHHLRLLPNEEIPPDTQSL